MSKLLLVLLLPLLCFAQLDKDLVKLDKDIQTALTNFNYKFDFSVLLPYEKPIVLSYVQINGKPYKINLNSNYRATNYYPVTSYNQIPILKNEGMPKFQNIYVASSFKTIVAMMILRRVEQGVIKLEDKVNATGASQNGIKSNMTIKDVLSDMIIYSDNECTRYLMNEVLEGFRPDSGYVIPGRDKKFVWINALIKNNNLEGLWLYHGWTDNAMTSYDTTKLYYYLWKGVIPGYGESTFINKSSRDYLLSLLKKQHWNDTLSSNMVNPDEPTPTIKGINTNEVDFYHKTGWTDNATNDAGLVLPKTISSVQPRCYTIALFSKSASFKATRTLGGKIDDLLKEFYKIYPVKCF